MSASCAPTLAGFQDFVTNVMMIDPAYLPVGAPVIGMAYTVASAIVNDLLACLPGGIYALAVYNLAASNLLNFAQDQNGRDYFAGMRKTLNINSFQPGMISSTGDNGTSTSLLNPEFMKNLTLANLQNMKDPYGRQYLMFAQAYGPSIVGLT